jgi:hypothetical protein
MWTNAGQCEPLVVRDRVVVVLWLAAGPSGAPDQRLLCCSHNRQGVVGTGTAML